MIGSFRVKSNGSVLKIVTTHLKAKEGFEEVRELQAKQLAREMRYLDNVIITGDFNDEPDSLAIKAMKAHKFTDVTEMTGEDKNRITTHKFR